MAKWCEVEFEFKEPKGLVLGTVELLLLPECTVEAVKDMVSEIESIDPNFFSFTRDDIDRGDVNIIMCDEEDVPYICDRKLKYYKDYAIVNIVTGYDAVGEVPSWIEKYYRDEIEKLSDCIESVIPMT